jgi:BACON domain-containing protein
MECNMLARDSKTDKLQVLFALLILSFAFTLVSPLQAQTFQTVPALAFTKAFAGAEPLPQVLTIAYTDQTTVRFSTAASTNSGGAWLSVSPAGNGCCFTPLAVQVIVTAGNLAAGTYTGQVVITNFANGGINMTIPVTLTVAASGATFFDDLPGKLSYSFKTSGTSTPQSIQIRKAGSGTLNWTVTASTGIGSGWLSASPTSGTAPSNVTISINKANLPGGGSTVGTFVGQLLFQTSGDSVTIPVAVHVGPTVFEQINPLNFTMPFAGANALAQVLNVAMNDNSTIRYSASVATAKGGPWLSISPTGNGCCFTPLAEVVSINAGSLAAGAYTGEIIITEFANPGRAMVVPVTLTVLSSGTFFADLPGQLSFSIKTNRTTATPQTVQVANGGSGTLNWTLATSTADGGNWLSGTPASGAAPSAVSVAIDVTQLPGGGAVAGEYIGQLVFQTTGDSTTIPVTVTVGAAPFIQLNPISFTMPFGGVSPLPQVLNVATIDSSTIRFSGSVATAKGGNWLSISPTGNGCCFTPLAITASVINAGTLAAGNYTGEIIFTEFANPGRSMVVPVNLTILSAGAFFADLPGELTFSFATGGHATSQVIQVGNGGTGTLNWTLSTSTADGGNWLSGTPVSGAAPSRVTISVDATQLPGGGALAGTFLGQLVFQTAGDVTTIPVSVTVGTAVFTQVNPIAFTMPFGGANPLPQTLTVATTDNSTIRFSVTAVTAKGGNWLSTSPTGNGCCFTPLPVAVSVNASTLAAGVYTGEIILTEFANPGRSMTVPVTLSVVASGAFFDNLPGQMNFSMKAGGKVSPQTIQILNGTSGKLSWTLTPTTADGGAWLVVSPLLGTAPKAVTVKISTLLLPGAGHIAGNYIGQLLLQSASGTATVGVLVTVGTADFAQINSLNFVMPVGGANPLPQVITAAAIDNSALRFSVSTATAKGGNWLSLSTTGNGCCFTPFPLRVSISATSLPVGVYVGEINLYQFANPGTSTTIPVTLTVINAAKAFFDNLPGQTSFSFKPSGTAPPSQTILIRNAGNGTPLNWTVAKSTADFGTWLSVLPVKGTDAGSYVVKVINSKLPGHGLVAGTFIGQQVVKTKSGNVTIPTVVTVGDPVFVQPPAVTFNTTVGVSPAPQVISIASTGAAIRFTPIAASAHGGNWLSVSPNGNGCCFTPTNVTFSVNASGLAAGSYTGEVNVIEFANPAKSMTVQVNLTVSP